MNYPSLSLKQDLIDEVFSGAKCGIQKGSDQSTSPGSIKLKKYKAPRLQNDLVEECDQCEYKTSKYLAMYRHKREKHLVLKQKCTDCDYSNIYPNRVKLHYNRVHMGIKRGKCRRESCEYAGTTNCIELYSHSMYFCKQCQMSFIKSDSLKFHSGKVHEGLVFISNDKCRRNSCEYAGTTNCLELQSHSYFLCEHCQLSFRRKDDLKFHVDKIHEGLVFNCTFCESYSTARKSTFKKHVLIKHSGEKSKQGQKPTICKEEGCTYTDQSINQLKRHVTSKHESIKLICYVEDCTFETSWNKNLRRHAKVHLEKSSSETIDCYEEGCNAKVIDIKKHMKIHTRGTTNTCKFTNCNFETYSKTYLSKHMKRCNLQFDYTRSKSETMYRHKRETHSGVKQKRVRGLDRCRSESCEYVGTKICLELPSHSLFVCKQCYVSFKRVDDLKFHNDKIHEGLVYNCENCDSWSTARKSDFKRHIRIKHSDKDSK